MLKKFSTALAALMILAACEEKNNDTDDDNDNNPSTTNKGSYTVQVQGDTNLTLEGEAIVNPFSNDTLVSISLIPDSANATTGIGGIQIFSNTAYSQQSLPIDGSASLEERAQFSINISNNQGIVGLTGTLTVTEAAKGEVVKGDLDMKAMRNPLQGDTLDVTGSFEARPPF